ncbi:MAG: hypothetical protein LUF27_16470 [Lachnospiraceae bacterium]|nr:hypothetical protein [Lachnospiraceae bacterium]
MDQKFSKTLKRIVGTIAGIFVAGPAVSALGTVISGRSAQKVVPVLATLAILATIAVFCIVL